MQAKTLVMIPFGFYLLMLFFSCNKNHPPVIEEFITDSDSVKTGVSVVFEVIISDADNDITKSYWFFDGKRKPEYDRKTKITWISPSTPGNVAIKVEVDDGKTDTQFTKIIVVY